MTTSRLGWVAALYLLGCGQSGATTTGSAASSGPEVDPGAASAAASAASAKCDQQLAEMRKFGKMSGTSAELAKAVTGWMAQIAEAKRTCDGAKRSDLDKMWPEVETAVKGVCASAGGEVVEQISPKQLTCKPGPETVAVTAEALGDAYAANEVAADQLYKDKLLAVTGVIESIQSGLGGEPFVVLKTKQMFQGAQVHGLTKEVAAALKKGDDLSVVCTGGGEAIGAPMLNKCRVTPAK